MTDPSNAVAPEEYLQAAAAANNFESFGRAIASSVLQASANPTAAAIVSALRPSRGRHARRRALHFGHRDHQWMESHVDGLHTRRVKANKPPILVMGER